MKGLFLVVLTFLIGGCATSTKQTDALVKDSSSLPEKSLLQDVVLIKQAKNHCGPASMAMVMNHAGIDVSLDELTSQMFTKEMEGTFKSDMISSVRRQGMLAIPINDLSSMLKELSDGHPVLVFQNLGLTWWPKWHYAVVTGHDLSGPDIYLHTGKEKFVKTDMRLFERSWILGGRWGILVLRPDQLSITASEKSHVEAAAMLEGLNKIDEAHLAYQTIFKRWPKGLPTLIGLGNVTYAKKQFRQSVKYLNLATQYHPESAIAWHNLATAQGALGEKTKASESSLKAIELADEDTRPSFKKSLKAWEKL